MLRRRQDVTAHIGWLDQVADAQRVGETERLAQFPHFQRGRHMHDLRAGGARRAAVENAALRPGQRIGLAAVGKREARPRIEPIDLLRAGGAARLAEPYVERHQSAADVRECAVEHDAALLVPVIAELDQRAHEASALRTAHHNRLGVCDQHRIVVAGIVLRRNLEKCAEVARGGKAEAQHQRSLAR